MAKKEFLIDIDLTQQRLLNAGLQVVATFPSSPVLAQFLWNSALSSAFVYTGSPTTPNTISGWLDLGQLYQHPTFTTGNLPGTAMTGARVPSRFTLDNGHLTVVETRELTATDIGAASGTHTHLYTDVTGLPANTILGNNTSGIGQAKAMTVSELMTLLGLAYGNLAQLNAGTDTAQRSWKAKDLDAWLTSRLGTYLTVVNLAYTASPTQGVVTNPAGTGATIPVANGTNAGLMSPDDKTKLDTVQNGANNYIHPTNNPGTHPFASEIASVVQVLSQIVVNTEGHVTTIKGRNLTAADLAAVLINDAINNGTNQTWSSGKIYTEIQAAIGQAQTGALQYKGNYDPTTNTPDITNPATGVKTGWTYVVSVAGTFLGGAVEAGDMIIAKQNDPGSTLANWQLVNKNIPAIVAATTTIQGIVRLATQSDYDSNDNSTAVTPALLKSVLNSSVGGYYATFGNGSSTSFTITHGLGTDRVDATFKRVSTKRQVEVEWASPTANTITINVNIAPSDSELEVIIKK